jgi:hypothetical protein
VQTKKMPPLPIVLVGREYWEQALNFPFLVAEGVIDRADAQLVQYAESAEQAWSFILEFYRGRQQQVAGAHATK